MTFRSYIQKLSIPENFKNQILDVNFISSNPVYYQKYPSLFAKEFSVSEEELELLNIAGFLYYQATLFTDSLLDEGDVSKFPLIAICQEESTKILTSIFGLENDFWKLWNSRRNEYIEAIYLERSFSKKENVTIEEYEILADKKSAFGKVAIDCLFGLEEFKNKNLHEKLLLSHKYFSVAFQLNDDIQDLKADIEKGQFNWAYYLLKKENIESKNPEILEKYLYIRGISKQMYQLGILYCDKALKVVENLTVFEWERVLIDTKKAFGTAIIEIDNYLEILTADIEELQLKKGVNDVQNSLKGAVDFVKKKQNENGSWREYSNQGGISNTWATAFISSKISNGLLIADFKNEIKNALLFLEENPIDLLWSYNTTWIEDADSTNFVLLTYVLNNKKIEEEVIERWLLFQNMKGAFSTYFDENLLTKALDDKSIESVIAWTNSHNCVSAVSFYFLALYNQENTSFVKLKNYFSIDFENKTDSYWWTSSIYTLSYLAKTYHLLGEFQKLNWIIEQILKQQDENGSFSDKYGINIFYTALATEILLLDSNLRLESIKSIDYLLQNQHEDGSWENSNALQVPNSSSIESDDLIYPVSSFGMNVRAKEFNRLFTTVSVLETLKIYERKYNS
jgi:hypothetical protein